MNSGVLASRIAASGCHKFDCVTPIFEVFPPSQNCKNPAISSTYENLTVISNGLHPRVIYEQDRALYALCRPERLLRLVNLPTALVIMTGIVGIRTTIALKSDWLCDLPMGGDQVG
jgi:hypothetical protein